MVNAFANRSLTQTHTSVNPSVIGYINNEDYTGIPRNLDLSIDKDDHAIITHEFSEDSLIYLNPRKYVSNYFNIIDPIIDSKSTYYGDQHINSKKDVGEVVVSHTSKIYHLIVDAKKSIDDIVEIDFDWEGRGLEMPNSITISTSKKIMEYLITEVFYKKCINHWIEPFVYSEEGGYICIGWYHANKTLYINIKDRIIKYRKLFNSDDDNSRKSKQGILDKDNCFSIWRWMFINE